jgi:hypothetical protein
LIGGVSFFRFDCFKDYQPAVVNQRNAFLPTCGASYGSNLPLAKDKPVAVKVD